MVCGTVSIMRAQHIKTGFHRAGIALAALFAVLGALSVWSKIADHPGEIIPVVITAAIAYGVMWAIGWVLAGFAGDGEKE